MYLYKNLVCGTKRNSLFSFIRLRFNEIYKETELTINENALQNRYICLRKYIVYENTGHVKVVTCIHKCGKQGLLKFMCQHLLRAV